MDLSQAMQPILLDWHYLYHYSLKINGTNLSEYTIVYAEYEGTEVMENNPDEASVTPDYEFNLYIAEELKSQLKKTFNVELNIEKDTELAAGDYEILIGNTNRTHPLAVELNEYSIFLYGDNVCINGGTPGAIWNSIDDFINYAVGIAKSAGGNGDITDDMYLNEYVDMIEIACIGDSITAAWKSSNVEYFSWPSALQRILWKDCVIHNFGVNGQDMRDDGKKPWKKNDAWTDCQAIAENLDYVLVMLGTNDSEHTPVFSDADNLSFVNSFMGILDTLSAKNSKIKYTLMNTPKYYASANFAQPFIRELQLECVSTAIAKGYDVKHFDMYTASHEKIGIANMPDGLHPDAKGYCMMGQIVADMLEDFYNIKN